MHYRFIGIDVQVVGMFFLWGALIFTLWSGADYFLKARHLLQ
jgi:CDP-diacylglycerol--glycerol-3-phosphate 3-phosphatidyltransferase